MMCKTRMLLILGLSMSAASPVGAQLPGDKLVVEPQAVLVMEHAAIGDRMGQAVALSGEAALAGCPLDSATVPRAGSVCVFVRDGEGWVEQAMLLPSDPMADAQFGWSLALSGNTALVGAPGHSSGRGAAYVFVRTGEAWVEQARLVASDPVWGDEFGWSVALSGNTAVVGAHFAGVNGKTSAGAAYVFLRDGTTWSEQQKLVAPDGKANDQFGHSLAVAGNTLLVGAPWNGTVETGYSAGAAYAFNRTGTAWTSAGKLVAPEWAAGENLGWSVALDGESALLGARRGDTPEVQQAGLARVFVREAKEWTQSAVLTALDATPAAEFGAAVAVTGGTAFVGAPWDGEAGTMSGAVYAFLRVGTEWVQQDKLLATGAETGEEFGSGMVLDMQTLLVGVPLDRVPDMGICGSACVFGFGVSAWTDLGFGLAGVAGIPTLAGIGTLEAGSPGALALADAAGEAPALLFIALTADPTPFKGGLLVPCPPDVFVPELTGNAGDLTLAWSAWPADVPPGVRFYFQFAVADLEAVQGVALSNALQADAP